MIVSDWFLVGVMMGSLFTYKNMKSIMNCFLEDMVKPKF